MPPPESAMLRASGTCFGEYLPPAPAQNLSRRRPCTLGSHLGRQKASDLRPIGGIANSRLPLPLPLFPSRRLQGEEVPPERSHLVATNPAGSCRRDSTNCSRPSPLPAALAPALRAAAMRAAPAPMRRVHSIAHPHSTARRCPVRMFRRGDCIVCSRWSEDAAPVLRRCQAGTAPTPPPAPLPPTDATPIALRMAAQAPQALRGFRR